MATRTARINALRGFCREFGLHVPVGARTGLEAMTRAVADDQSALPELLRPKSISQYSQAYHLSTYGWIRTNTAAPMPAAIATDCFSAVWPAIACETSCAITHPRFACRAGFDETFLPG